MKLKITRDVNDIISLIDIDTQKDIMKWTQQLIDDLQFFHGLNFYTELKTLDLTGKDLVGISQEDFILAIDTWLEGEQNNENKN